jgi:hypothetical protein
LYAFRLFRINNSTCYPLKKKKKKLDNYATAENVFAGVPIKEGTRFIYLFLMTRSFDCSINPVLAGEIVYLEFRCEKMFNIKHTQHHSTVNHWSQPQEEAKKKWTKESIL